MKYRVIDGSGHAFPIGTIISNTNYFDMPNIYIDTKLGLQQYLRPDQIVKLIDYLNINIRVL